MSADIFALAREAVTRSLIESIFGCDDSRWEGDEYKTLSPLRADRHLGSFSIKENGHWYDFATGEAETSSNWCSGQDAALHSKQ